jgi:hypothetical protein
MRKYLATFDNGHDYCSVEFESDYRAGSKMNEEDAKNELWRKLGGKTAKYFRLTNVSRI